METNKLTSDLLDDDDEELNLSPEEEAQINEMYEKVYLALKKIES